MLETILRLKSEGRIAALNQHIPYARFLGLACEDDGNGLVTVLRYADRNIGNTDLPALHGGAVAALLEHAALMQLLTETEPETLPKTINLSVDYLRPCGRHDTFARGRIFKQGRRIANVRVEAWQEDPARPVAAAHAHFLLG